jgi:hypothetical protein
MCAIKNDFYRRRNMKMEQVGLSWTIDGEDSKTFHEKKTRTKTKSKLNTKQQKFLKKHLLSPQLFFLHRRRKKTESTKRKNFRLPKSKFWRKKKSVKMDDEARWREREQLRRWRHLRQVICFSVSSTGHPEPPEKPSLSLTHTHTLSLSHTHILEWEWGEKPVGQA